MFSGKIGTRTCSGPQALSSPRESQGTRLVLHMLHQTRSQSLSVFASRPSVLTLLRPLQYDFLKFRANFPAHFVFVTAWICLLLCTCTLPTTAHKGMFTPTSLVPPAHVLAQFLLLETRDHIGVVSLCTGFQAIVNSLPLLQNN